MAYLINQDGVNVIAKDENKRTPLAVAKRYEYTERMTPLLFYLSLLRANSYHNPS